MRLSTSAATIFCCNDSRKSLSSRAFSSAVAACRCSASSRSRVAARPLCPRGQWMNCEDARPFAHCRASALPSYGVAFWPVRHLFWSAVSCLPLGSGRGIVAGQTSTSEGVRTGFVQPLIKASSMSLLGHSRPMHLVPVPINVRCYSNSNPIVRRSEVTLRANLNSSGQQIASSFDHPRRHQPASSSAMSVMPESDRQPFPSHMSLWANSRSHRVHSITASASSSMD